MPDDFDSRIDSLSKAPSSSGGDDFDSRIDSLSAPAKESPIKGALAAAGANLLPGLASIPEQSINMYQAWERNKPDWLGPPSMLSAGLSAGLPKLNQAMGQAPIPYLNATNALKQAPMYGGQSAQQLSQGHPLAAGVGQFAGQLPYWLTGVGEAGLAAEGLPLAARVASGAATGAGLSGLTAGAEDVSEQAKSNDAVDPDKLMATISQNASIGGLLGAVSPMLSPIFRRLFPAKAQAIAEQIKALPDYKKRLPAVIQPTITPTVHGEPLVTKPLPQMGPPRLGYHVPVPAVVPKALPYRVPIEMGQRGPEYLSPRFEDMRHPPVTTSEVVHAEVLPREPVAQPAPEPKPKVAKPAKQAKIKITVDPSRVTSSDAAIAQRVDELTFYDPEESWRDWWNSNVERATAQQLPLARQLARLKIKRDAIYAKLQSANKQILDELQIQPDLHRRQLDPKDAELLTQIAKDLGGEPEDRVAYTASSLAPGSQFPIAYDFKKPGLKAHLSEARDLDNEFKEVSRDYERFKENKDEQFSELFPLNKSVQVGVHLDEYGDRAVNIRRIWRPTKYKFPNPEAKAKYQTAATGFENRAAQVPELNTPAFKRVISKVLNAGNNLRVEQLADRGAFDWFNNLGKDTQTKIVLAIGISAALYAGNEQKAEAAPPAIVAKVIKKLYQGSWKEWMGSGPITFLTKLEMTTDMLSKGFDSDSRRFFAQRMQYMHELERANVGARQLTETEKQLVAGAQPWQLRRANLPGWTQMEKNKLGDIAQLNTQYKALIKGEVERLNNLEVKPASLGQAERYMRALHMDAHDMGIDLGYNPRGAGMEAMDKLTGEIMKSQSLANYGWALDHAFEATMATMSKYPGATGRAIRGLADNPLYREFAIANSPKGFFQQMLESERGFEYRRKIDKWVNERIDNAIKKHLGEVGFELLAAQLPERAKLGLNGLVITLEEAKNYPGGADQYMRDWLASAKNRAAIPQARQLEFDKVATKIQIEKNIATGFVPEGPIKERTVFQRTQAFSLGISYTRGKIQQSRFVASLFDDALRHAASGNWMEVGKSLRALIYAHLFLFGAAGSAFVPPYVWFMLEQADRTTYGTVQDVQDVKDELDRLQKNVGPGYQKRELGPSGVPLTGVPSSAVMSMYNSLIRDAHPKNKSELLRLLADAVTATLLSRIGPFGNLNLRYMLEYTARGIKGQEQITGHERGLISQVVATTAGKTQLLGSKKVKMTPTEGIVKALTRATTPEELQAEQKFDAKSAKRLPRLVKQTGRSLQHAFRK